MGGVDGLDHVGRLPLVEMASSTSPGWPRRGPAWRDLGEIVIVGGDEVELSVVRAMPASGGRYSISEAVEQFGREVLGVSRRATVTTSEDPPLIPSGCGSPASVAAAMGSAMNSSEANGLELSGGVLGDAGNEIHQELRENCP